MTIHFTNAGGEPAGPDKECELGRSLCGAPPFGSAAVYIKRQQQQEQNRADHNRVQSQDHKRLDESANPPSDGPDTLFFDGGL